LGKSECAFVQRVLDTSSDVQAAVDADRCMCDVMTSATATTAAMKPAAVSHSSSSSPSARSIRPTSTYFIMLLRQLLCYSSNYSVSVTYYDSRLIEKLALAIRKCYICYADHY